MTAEDASSDLLPRLHAEGFAVIDDFPRKSGVAQRSQRSSQYLLSGSTSCTLTGSLRKLDTKVRLVSGRSCLVGEIREERQCPT